MISRNPESMIADFPAYTIFRARESIINGYVEVHHGDEFQLRIRDQFTKFRFGSVVGYACQHAECPFAAHNNAIDLGHETHWVTQMSISITNGKQEKKQYVALSMGQVVLFEGKKFKLTETHNDNIELVEVK